MIKHYKKILSTLSTFVFGLLLTYTHAQTTYGDTIFYDNFGQHITRVTTPYMPSGSYLFAIDNGSNNEKEIQDNHYAVVDPLHIIDANPGSYFWTSTSPTATVPANAQPYYTKDHTGNTNGAVMVVNAGTTVNYLYKRQVKLKTGFRYRFAFWIYVVRKSSQFSMEVINQTNNNTNTFAGPILDTEGVWKEYTLDFPVPLSAAFTTNDISAGLQNKYSQIIGNDYYIDDILLSTLHTDPVTISATNGSPVCQGESIQLRTNVGGGAPPFVYSWTGPNGYTSSAQHPTLPNVTGASSGIYTVTVTDAIGQTATATTNAIVNPGPNSDFAISEKTINSRHNLVSFSIIPEKKVVYNWDLGDGTTSDQTTITHTYTITGDTPEFIIKLSTIDSIGCSSSTSKIIDVVPFIPNVFSPNGDGINDLFMQGFELQVYDRNGIVIYKGMSGWDGTYKGKKIDNDTYFYNLNYRDKNQETQTRKGYFTLIR